MRVYEELFIVKPDTPEEEVDGFVEQIKTTITNGKGTVDKADRWGVRKLAYKVSKYSEGNYILIQFTSTPELVHEVERRMRVADMVIKFITVRVDEKQKKIDKRKKARDKRAARKPAIVHAAPVAPAAAPGAPAVGAPGMPAAPAPAMPAEPSAAPAAAAPAAPAAPVETPAETPVETPVVAVEGKE